MCVINVRRDANNFVLCLHKVCNLQGHQMESVYVINKFLVCIESLRNFHIVASHNKEVIKILMCKVTKHPVYG